MNDWQFGNVVREKSVDKLFFVIGHSDLGGPNAWMAILLEDRGVVAPEPVVHMLWTDLHPDAFELVG